MKCKWEIKWERNTSSKERQGGTRNDLLCLLLLINKAMNNQSNDSCFVQYYYWCDYGNYPQKFPYSIHRKSACQNNHKE